MSAPEKVFEYFASVHKGKEAFMTVSDFMRSILPFDYRHRDNTTPNNAPTKDLESSVFAMIDVDGDGLISFPEYIFFITLLAIPKQHFRLAFHMFDYDGSGGVSLEEFTKMMEVMRSQSPHGQQQRTRSVGELGGLLETFFGRDGSKMLDYPTWEKFMTKLHHDVLKLEVTHCAIGWPGSNIPPLAVRLL